MKNILKNVNSFWDIWCIPRCILYSVYSCGGCSRLRAISLNIINIITLCCTYGLYLTSSKNDRDHKEHMYTYTYIYIILCLQSIPFHSKCPHYCYFSHSCCVYYIIIQLHPATYLAYYIYIYIMLLFIIIYVFKQNKNTSWGLRHPNIFHLYNIQFAYQLHIL